MCGIAGFLGLKAAPAELDRVAAAMLADVRHRGPDDEGLWRDPARGLVLGMRRLSIVDLPGGHQPCWNEDETVGVVFNGEIYNHAGLRTELSARGHRFASRADTEVLVHLYEEGGVPAMLARLRGMFAFALIDRPRHRLVLARDPFGMKPLYVSRQHGVLAFASEAKSLRRVPGFTLTPDPARYLDYASWLSLPAPFTHWHEVEKLRPGEWQEWDTATGDRIRSGVTGVMRFAPSGDLAGDAAATAELDAALAASVHLHLQADVPVGILLSGGLDSRTIGFYAGRAHSGRLHTYTAGTGRAPSEFAAARETARALGSTHHEIALDGLHFAASIDRLAWHLDEPIGDPAAYAVWQLCAAAHGEVKVLLSGEGADELFAGYAERYAGMVVTTRKSDLLRRVLGWLPSSAAFGLARWDQWHERAHLSLPAELAGLRIEGVGRHFPELLSPAQARALRVRQEELAAAVGFLHSERLSACQQLDLGWQLPESLLMKADKMSMAASIELRCPFLDRDVAGVAARLPPAQRLDSFNTMGKVALRRTLARHLADDSLLRPKVGFDLPLGTWLRGPARDVVESRLLAPGAVAAEAFGAPAVKKAWAAFVSRERPGAHLFYALWLYECWHAAQR